MAKISISEAKKRIAELQKLVDEVEDKSDQTKGVVGSQKENESPQALGEDGITMEVAESGKGFAIWRDYNQCPKTGKLKRLIR